MHKLRIAFISVARAPIPPGITVIDGIGNISSQLAEQLSKNGHEITFFCPKGSTVKTERVESELVATSEFYDEKEFQSLTSVARSELVQPFNLELHLLMERYLLTNTFDIIHFNTSPLIFSLPFSRKITVPKVFTLHDQFPDSYNKILDKYNDIKNNFFVSISFAQRLSISNLNYIANIYHGIDTESFPFTEKPNNYLFFSGRFHPAKGLDIAIEVAKKLQKQLLFTGHHSYSNAQFFNQSILPSIDNNQIVNKQITSKNELVHLYSLAKVLLFPIQWEEPFGLVLIEAMATGTPVVAFARGSVPEVIKDGETGFIVNPSDDDIRGNFIIKKTGIEGLCEAVERMYSLKKEEYEQMRKNSRERVQNMFTIQKMAAGYEQVYQKLLAR